MEEYQEISPAMERPCNDCPWLLANQGKPHPDGWYTKANLRRLWTKIRQGYGSMTCHPTDPNNPIPDGWRKASKDIKTRECAGVLVLVQREIHKMNADADAYFDKPLRARMTKEGMIYWALERGAFGGMPFIGGRSMTAVDLDAPVGHEPLGPWNGTDVA